MIKKVTGYRLQLVGRWKSKRSLLQVTSYKLQAGFSLIETLVAVTLLVMAILAPMTLATQSLAGAYFARDQVTAFHLAQEAIESVRSVRDGNILRNSLGTSINLLNGIPNNAEFVIDTRDNMMNTCSGTCPSLRTDGNFYAYGPVGTTEVYSNPGGWTTTRFTRTIKAEFVPNPAVESDEIRVTSTVTWRSGTYQTRTFRISENLYRWVDDGSAQ